MPAVPAPWSSLERLHAELGERNPSVRRCIRSRTVDSMLDCIHRHVFETDFDVAKLRRLCRIADNNQSSRFRLLVGLTPRAYIERLRLDAAACLLREHPDANVLDIAYLVGYEHPQTFYRAFRRRFGGPPGEVLERNRP